MLKSCDVPFKNEQELYTNHKIINTYKKGFRKVYKRSKLMEQSKLFLVSLLILGDITFNMTNKSKYAHLDFQNSTV